MSSNIKWDFTVDTLCTRFIKYLSLLNLMSNSKCVQNFVPGRYASMALCKTPNISYFNIFFLLLSQAIHVDLQDFVR